MRSWANWPRLDGIYATQGSETLPVASDYEIEQAYNGRLILADLVGASDDTLNDVVYEVDDWRHGQIVEQRLADDGGRWGE